MHGTRRDLIIAALWAASPAFTEESKVMGTKSMNNEDIGAVSPALEHYTKEALMHGLWKRAELSPRDRSIVTVAALIARMQSNEMPYYFALALDNGVKPGELSEIITHLAFYSGWPNAMAAVSVAREIFRQRGIGSDHLPPAK
jgi:4-carboxymuconolactone decarboxylase